MKSKRTEGRGQSRRLLKKGKLKGRAEEEKNVKRKTERKG